MTTTTSRKAGFIKAPKPVNILDEIATEFDDENKFDDIDVNFLVRNPSPRILNEMILEASGLGNDY